MTVRAATARAKGLYAEVIEAQQRSERRADLNQPKESGTNTGYTIFYSSSLS